MSVNRYNGYILYSENVDVKSYILRCARAFGPCAHQQDESLDNPPKIPSAVIKNITDSWSKNQLKLVTKQHKKFLSISNKKLEAEVESEYQEELKYYFDTIKRNEEIINKVTPLITEVTAWKAPESHAKLKEFALQQLTDLIKWNVMNVEKPVKKDAKKYLKAKIAYLEKDIEYYEEKVKKESKIDKGCDDWILDLYKSLGLNYG